MNVGTSAQRFNPVGPASISGGFGTAQTQPFVPFSRSTYTNPATTNFYTPPPAVQTTYTGPTMSGPRAAYPKGTSPSSIPSGFVTNQSVVKTPNPRLATGFANPWKPPEWGFEPWLMPTIPQKEQFPERNTLQNRVARNALGI